MGLKLKSWIDTLPEYVAGKTIDQIRKKYNLTEVYKMASNENIFGPCSQVKEFLKNNLEDINYYPDSDALEIRQRLANKHDISYENIIMGNGTDQVIEMICDCFIDKGDNIVTADPNFLIYEKATLKCGGKVIKVPLNKKGLRQDVRKIISSINKNTRIIFLASPHNPTGTIITGEEVKLIIDNTPKDMLVVLDEAYYEYLEDKDKINTVGFIKNNANLVSLRTFSKIYGLAGLRIGYGIASSQVVSALNKIRLPFNTSLFAQKAAVKALENDWYVSQIREGILNEKKKFYNVFSGLDIDYIESFANFILLKTGEKSMEIIERLLENGYIVRPGENLGVPGYIRVTISRPEINDRFLKKFVEIYKYFYAKTQ